MADRKVAIAVADVSVHTTSAPPVKVEGNDVYDVTTVILGPGESVPLDSIPPYERERVESGEITQLRVMGETEAEELRAAHGMANAGPEVVLEPGQSALATDTSFSNHLVADVERVANHHRLAEAESGEELAPDAAEALGVVLEETPNSPATSGRRTRGKKDDTAEESAEADE